LPAALAIQQNGRDSIDTPHLDLGRRAQGGIALLIGMQKFAYRAMSLANFFVGRLACDAKLVIIINVISV
jgi:hypothetical protein